MAIVYIIKKPFKAKLIDSVWKVSGSLNVKKGFDKKVIDGSVTLPMMGGVPYFLLDKMMEKSLEFIILNNQE